MTDRFPLTPHYGWIINEYKSLHSMKYALPVALMFAISGPSYAVDNNLHFTGHLLSKSCTLVVNGGLLAEVHFPVVSNRDLMVAGQSSRVPVVFNSKIVKGHRITR